MLHWYTKETNNLRQIKNRKNDTHCETGGVINNALNDKIS